MKFLQSPYSIFMILALLSLLAAAVCIAIPRPAEPAEPDPIVKMINRLDHAPSRTLKKNGPGWQLKFSESYQKYANKYRVPDRLLVSITFHESNFLQGVKGDHGRSWGLMQVGPYGRKKCKCENMKTYDDEIKCGACWLRAGVDWCGDLNKGLTAYVCGHCTTKLNRTLKKVHSRLRIAGLPYLRIFRGSAMIELNHNIIPAKKETGSVGE
jgi:hypothetical protein